MERDYERYEVMDLYIREMVAGEGFVGLFSRAKMVEGGCGIGGVVYRRWTRVACP